jgi:hypothetical protein
MINEEVVMKLGIVFGLAVAIAGPLMAGDVREIELRRLFEPTPAELQSEAKGRIFIYEGLRDTDVEQAMEQQFNRIESMMFIRVQRTNEKGEVKKDPKTGAVLVQDDGC